MFDGNGSARSVNNAAIETVGCRLENGKSRAIMSSCFEIGNMIVMPFPGTFLEKADYNSTFSTGSGVQRDIVTVFHSAR